MNAALMSPVKYLTSKKAPYPENINVRIQIILYAVIRSKVNCSGIEEIELSGVMVEDARLTPLGKNI
jgi:hypothetical protein